MKALIAASIKYQDNQLLILDQYLLPHEQVWHECESIREMIHLIQSLQIRGAPAIGIAASILIAMLAERGTSKMELTQAISDCRAARPTAVNLMNCMDAMQQALEQSEFVDALVITAESIFEQDRLMCDAMATFGAQLINDGDNLLTHCNTGALATAGVGTALGVFLHAHQAGKNIHVWVDETRPLLQGGRLTAYELGNWKIDYTLICDNMAASLMAKGKVDKIFVGADRIAANGDFANKVGTYNLAVLANFHNVEFYVVAPVTTLDIDCESGTHIPIEQRASSEVTGVSGSFGSCQWAPKQAKVYNPAFDVTPANLVTGWVLDTGVYYPQDVLNGCLKTL
ncbi:S-methyl-5-thioribose-1-phosphate isomerase [Marinicellulosiphila megalodicopiae]|uniref:S-methyl-5-thioribose-1-phosphate isomerase n=1 Tax=Marinicellulosiphila megalodicopiae TaxID=2724896 RepID=UPI003BAF8DD3